MPDESVTENRKIEHIKIAVEEETQFRNKTNGFEDIELVYKTLPEINKKEIDLSTNFFGKTFSFPLMVSGMTGGAKEAEKINKDIAKACEEIGIGMGLGSMRAMLENPELANTYVVKDIAPDIFLAGNIGVTHLKEYSVNELENALKEVKADALAIHLNASQESIQAEGDTDFEGFFKEIERVSEKIKYPVIVKEVGAGLNGEVSERMEKTKVKAIDVSGAGGTSWNGIEYLRKKDKEQAFWDFGIPTAVALIEGRKNFSGKVIASGGIRNGEQIVKAIALGADLCAIAQPVIKAQHNEGREGVKKLLLQKMEEVRTGMFVLGAKNLEELKKAKYIATGKTREWIESKAFNENNKTF